MFRPPRSMRRRASHGTFDPKDNKHVKHTRIGIWDLYEQRYTDRDRTSKRYPKIPRMPGLRILERRLEVLQDLPFVLRMLKDIASIKSCWIYLVLYLVIEVVDALVPALEVWYSGQFLNIIQTAIDNRTIDTHELIRVAIGRTACHFVTNVMMRCRNRVELPLSFKIKQYYSMHYFNSMARLDVPTFEDSIIQRRLEDASPFAAHNSSIAWQTARVLIGLGSTALRLISQLSVLVTVLRHQRDGPMFAVMHFSQTLYTLYRDRSAGSLPDATAWAATTDDLDYIRMEGMKRVVYDAAHRKELVADNLKEFLTAQFRQIYDRIHDGAADFHELVMQENTKLSFFSLLSHPLQDLPQIVYIVRAAQHPISIPMSVTSMRLIEETTWEFLFNFVDLITETGSIAERFRSVRQLYEIEHIPNKVVGGTVPFPEDQQSLRSGILVEFRHVSFRYPDSEQDALKDLSFKIEKGQLCVLVGSNGSGKSTVLKLIMRLYDPTEGQILIDGQDIKSLRLSDLRQTISVLFQDYTHFPLSIKDNIGLGDPSQFHDEDKIREAARLGGSENFIDNLPEGFETYLDRPVRDYYSNIPEGTKTLFGRPVSFDGIRSVMRGKGDTNKTPLSGGQMQRLAVSRTFMRSVVSDEAQVGLLLFDEPSASLDPKAEHDLFTRLRNLRGEKTMIFSSHRFGQLTRHADLILFKNDSVIHETGTHNELIKQEGKYAELWNLQAQAFI